MKSLRSTRFLIEASAIAAIYIALTYIFAPQSFGPIQVRISEALTVLPLFTGAAVPGLFIGCLLSNLLMGNGLLDVAVGSLATLAAALLTRKLRGGNRAVAILPPVLVNAIVIGAELHILFAYPLFETMATVGIGQVAACYLLGYPLSVALSRHELSIFNAR